MFGLTRDFVQQDGICMMLGEPDGLPAGKLNKVQARMLMNTGIPHHLRLLLKEIDMKVTLEYAVSRKKMLSHLLKSEKLSMISFFGLLLQIAQGMEDGRLYMLRAEQYALHEDYIFIEGTLQNGKVYLTYIPLQAPETVVRPGEGFRSLIMVLMAAITELAGGGVQRLLQYCGEEEFTPAGLKKLLSELLTEGDSIPGYPSREEYSAVEEHPVIVPLAEEEEPILDRPAPKQSRGPLIHEMFAGPRKTLDEHKGNAAAVQHDPVPWRNGYPSLRMKEDKAFSIPEDDGDANDKSSSSRIYIILGCLLSDALLWKFLYLDHPSGLWLTVCGIATITLVVLSWMVWNGVLRLGHTEDEDDAEAEPVGRKLSKKELEWNFGRNPVASVRSAGLPKLDSQPYSAAGRLNTQAEARAGERNAVKPPAAVAATALLSREKATEEGQEMEPLKRTVPYLQRSDEEEAGDQETIELNRSSFIIGRSAEVAQYVERSEGASRVHAEISRGPAGYVLKDLDSRNGTLYEGEAMIPYKEYPLTEGTVFKIVKGSYKFHTA